MNLHIPPAVLKATEEEIAKLRQAFLDFCRGANAGAVVVLPPGIDVEPIPEPEPDGEVKQA